MPKYSARYEVIREGDSSTEHFKFWAEDEDAARRIAGERRRKLVCLYDSFSHPRDRRVMLLDISVRDKRKGTNKKKNLNPCLIFIAAEFAFYSLVSFCY
jgi:hypothetical protein